MYLTQKFFQLTSQQSLKVETPTVPIFQMRNWRSQGTCLRSQSKRESDGQCLLKKSIYIPNPLSPGCLHYQSWKIFILTFPAFLSIWVVFWPMTPRQKVHQSISEKLLTLLMKETDTEISPLSPPSIGASMPGASF